MSGRERGAPAWLERTLAAPALVQALAVAARLGIFDLVHERPRSALLLASTVGVHPEALARLLRALAAEGVLALAEDGQFGATPVSGLLRREAAAPYRERLLALANHSWDAWPGLLQAVETGRPAAPGRAPGVEPPASAVAALRKACAGGGPTFTVAGPGADRWLEAAVPAETGCPPGEAQLPLAAGGGLSGFDDAQAALALAGVHRALPPGGRLLLLEPVLPPEPAAPPALARLDLELLVFGAGRLRQADEWRRLLERQGLRLDRLEPVPGGGGWALFHASRGLV